MITYGTNPGMAIPISKSIPSSSSDSESSYQKALDYMEFKEGEMMIGKKIDYVFLDGGHDYLTVMNDLDCCNEVLINNGIILCDDYDLSYAPGVKQAIDEFTIANKLKCQIICNGRFAKIEKN